MNLLTKGVSFKIGKHSLYLMLYNFEPRIRLTCFLIIKMLDLKDLREEYGKGNIEREFALFNNPYKLFEKWIQQALDARIQDVNAMVLSTVSFNLRPSSRVVLLKGFSENGFQFYTNYNSRKSKEIEENKNASLLFFWPLLEKQIRIEGEIAKVPKNQSDDYFNSRPRASQLSAIISPQSEEIIDKESLLKKRVLINKTEKLSRPHYWGGYVLIAKYFEFWQGGKYRMHDRLVFLKEKNRWISKWLAP